MPIIILDIHASYHDRIDESLSLSIKKDMHTLDILDYPVSLTTALYEKLPDQSKLTMSNIPSRGLMIGDLLIYTDDPTTVCFRQADGDFIQHKLTSEPHIFTSTSRFPLETSKHIFWCYEKRSYTIRLQF